MPHQCTKCGKVYPDAAEELLNGCNCGSRFFYYIRQEKFDAMQSEVKKVMTELEKADKDQIEKDIRELTGLDKKPDEPVILDLESVRVLQPGKFEIDIVSLFSKNRPLIYKLGEGKYIIDIASSMGVKDDRKKPTDFSEFEELEEEDENNEKEPVEKEKQKTEETKEEKQEESNKPKENIENQKNKSSSSSPNLDNNELKELE